MEMNLRSCLMQPYIEASPGDAPPIDDARTRRIAAL